MSIYTYAEYAVWAVDMGSPEWIAARSISDAIDWYHHMFFTDIDDRQNVADAFDGVPCALETMHYRDLSTPSEGKESFMDSLKTALATPHGDVFILSTTEA